jgi:cell division septal protein FtsQ
MNMATYSLNNNKLEFLRHNNKVIKRNRKIKEIRLKGVHIILIIMIFSLIAVGIFYFGKFIMTWKKLNINTYILENSSHINQNQIKDILMQYRGNILGANLGKMRGELMDIGQVKDVSINRLLPSSIKISFTKRIPILQFKFNKKWSIIDKEGVILDCGKDIDNNLLIVRGVSKNNIEELIPYVDEFKSIKDKIEYISIKKPFGILLKLKGDNIKVFPGVKDFKKKIGYFFKLRKKEVLKYMKIISIDMRFEDRIYFEYVKEDVKNG